MSKDPQPHIEITSSTYIRANKPDSVQFTYDCDRGPLALPDHLKKLMGTRKLGISDIAAYGDIIPLYEQWLRAEIGKGNQSVMIELDKIFNLALDKGAYLVTSRHLTVAVTHAHKISKIIMELASG